MHTFRQILFIWAFLGAFLAIAHADRLCPVCVGCTTATVHASIMVSTCSDFQQFCRVSRNSQTTPARLLLECSEVCVPGLATNGDVMCSTNFFFNSSSCPVGSGMSLAEVSAKARSACANNSICRIDMTIADTTILPLTAIYTASCVNPCTSIKAKINDKTLTGSVCANAFKLRASFVTQMMAAVVLVLLSRQFIH